MSWTDERIEQLRQLWGNGITASQIADELGGVSRNAVIGKAHRLGLKARPSPVKSNDPAKKDAPKKPVAVKEAAPVSSTATAAHIGEKVTAAPRPIKKAEPIVTDKPPFDDDDAAPVAKARTDDDDAPVVEAKPAAPQPRVVSIGPGGFMRQGPGDQQPPIPPAPPRRLVPAKPSPEIADKTSLLDLNEKICRWPISHPGEPDFHFCGTAVNPGFPYCVEHCGRAYQAQLPRGVRRAPPPMPFGGPRVR
jgi:GcrA cell cycle regulator